MKRFLGLTLAATIALSAAAIAAPERQRIRGTVSASSANALTVHTPAGDDVSMAITGDTKYSKVVGSSLDKIEPGSYIGTATKTVGDQLVALEVVVFPPAMKGAGEGHYGWDRIPDTTLSGGASTTSMMTNGTVTTVAPGAAAPAVESSMTNGSVTAASTKGAVKQITVTYKGGEQTILVPPTAPIVTFQPGAMSDLKTGSVVFIIATKDDGKITADRINIGTEGVNPPM
jgi:hypothetical protein